MLPARHAGFVCGIVALLLGACAQASAQDSAAAPPKKAEPAKGIQAELTSAEKARAEQEKGEIEHEKDDSIGRALWFNEWFGSVTPEYLDFKISVAEREIQRWGYLIPGAPAYRRSASVFPERGTVKAGLPNNLWFEIGPFRGHTQIYRDIRDANIADTGRPTVILPHPYDPGLIYVGYAGGGLWRCRNANVASNDDWIWEPVTDSLPGGGAAGNLSIGSACFKPEDPDTIYLALGDMMSGSQTAEGRGFFITNDGGTNWIRGGELGATTRVKTVLALPDNIVLVAGNRGLFRSIDGGRNFMRVQSGPLRDGTGINHQGAAYPTNYNASSWDIVRLEDGALVLTYQFLDTGYGVYGGGGVAYSVDNGATWSSASMGPGFPANGFGRISIAASGSTLYGLYMPGDVPLSTRAFPKALMKSKDGGRSWVYQAASGLFSVDNDGTQAGYNQMIAVDPQNPDSVFVAANFSLYRSRDGGLTFSQMTSWIGNGFQYTHADFHVHAWAPTGPKTLYLGTDGGLSIVRQPDINPIPSAGNGNQSVSDPAVIDHRRNRKIATQLVYNIASTTAATPQGSRDRVIAGFQDLGTRLRLNNDGSGTFDNIIGGDGFGCLIHPYNGNLMLASLYYARIYRSANGQSFSQSYSTISGSDNSSLSPFHTRLLHTMADPTGNRVYTYTNAVPYVSDDFGATWSPLNTSGNGWPAGSIRQFGASPLKLGLVGATFDVSVSDGAGYRRGRVAISEDNGETWRTFTGFPGGNNSMADIAFDTANPDIMYATSVRPALWNVGGAEGGLTASHIWKSIDGGRSWRAIDGSQAISNGFPFGIPVHVVKVDPIDNNVVYAGTDVGLYRTTNQGNTWERFGEGLPLVAVRDIYIAPDGSFMRLGTHGRGVWEMQGITDSYAPRIIAQPHPSPTMASLAGVRMTLSVGAVALPAPAHQWQYSADNGASWTNIPNANERTYSFTPYGADRGRQFRALATNSMGSAQSNPVALDLNPYDIDGAQGVDVYDLLKLLSVFGSGEANDILLGDFNGDGKIDNADLALILDAF